MIARSIHPIPPPPSEPSPESESHEATAPRARRVTNDPAREYAQRPGEVEPLPNAVAALILCKKGWAKIERHQVKITLDGEDLVFASRDSIVIAAKNGTGERALWALNRRAPELLHLLTNDGAYIESVPRKGEAQWFSGDEASRAAYADAQAQIQRDAARLRELHSTDTAAAARAAQENAATTHRLIQTFPADAPMSTRVTGDLRVPAQSDASIDDESTPGRDSLFPKAETLAEAMESGDRQRAAHTGRVVSEAARTASTLRLGAALREEVFGGSTRAAAAPAALAEDLDAPDFFPTTRTNQPTTLKETC